MVAPSQDTGHSQGAEFFEKRVDWWSAPYRLLNRLPKGVTHMKNHAREGFTKLEALVSALALILGGLFLFWPQPKSEGQFDAIDETAVVSDGSGGTDPTQDIDTPIGQFGYTGIPNVLEQPKTTTIPAELKAAATYLARFKDRENTFRAQKQLDANGNGEGEYGFPTQIHLSEVSVNNGVIEDVVDGYDLIAYLPGPTENGRVPGFAEGQGDPDPANAEEMFVAYVFPANGEGPVFFMNQCAKIQVFANRDGRFSRENPPSFDLAFLEEGNMGSEFAKQGAQVPHNRTVWSTAHHYVN